MPTRAQYAAITAEGCRIRSPASTTTGSRPLSRVTDVNNSCSDSKPILCRGATGFSAW